MKLDNYSLIIIFSVLIFGINFNLLNAQNSGKLRGFVTDTTNGEVLAYSNIYIEELRTGTSTDDKGYFFISSIPPNQYYTVIVSYVGYVTKTQRVFIAVNKITHLDISLNLSTLELQTIEKVGEKIIEKNATDLGLQRITIKELETLPKGVETDIFRSLQYMPGVRTTGDVTARYYVRGGASNQNLVLINGVSIYNPFHALGIFSVIDPDMINNIEFYKGGFGAEFGSRLSSVLKLITKDGNKRNFGAKVTSSFITIKGLAEGPIPHGSFIITGRKSYSNQILKKFLNDQNVPFNFYDFSGKLNYSNPDFIPGSKFVFHSFFSGDKVENNNPFKEDFRWFNNIGGFSWFQVYDSPLFSELNISISNFSGEVVPKLSNALARKNELTDISLKMNFTYIYDRKDELGVGLDIRSIESKYFIKNKLGTVTDISEKAANISLFARYKLLSFEDFGADVGSRVNLIGLHEKGSFIFEPRASFTYRIFSDISIKAAWGIYLQELTTITNENEVISLFEPWVIIPEYLEPSKAIHYATGIDLFPDNDISVEVEGYYKKLNNIPAINQKKQIQSDPDLISGSGESYGWEFLLRFKPYPIRFTASYAIAWAYLNVDDWLYYPKYDSRHTVNLILDVNLGAGWSASATWLFNSGLPFTPFIGYYDKIFFDDFHSDNFIFDTYSSWGILGDKNISRLPEYHRLDLSLTKKFSIYGINLDLDVSVINVYDRKNIFYFKRDTGERINMLPLLPTATLKVEI